MSYGNVIKRAFSKLCHVSGTSLIKVYIKIVRLFLSHAFLELTDPPLDTLSRCFSHVSDWVIL